MRGLVTSGLKHAIEGKIEGRTGVTGRRGKRCWELEEEALDRTLWRTRFGRGCGRVVRQTTK